MFSLIGVSVLIIFVSTRLVCFFSLATSITKTLDVMERKYQITFLFVSGKLTGELQTLTGWTEKQIVSRLV